jgi:hypothetical protein
VELRWNLESAAKRMFAALFYCFWKSRDSAKSLAASGSVSSLKLLRVSNDAKLTNIENGSY